MGVNAKFSYAQHVVIKPLDNAPGRVVDVHFFGQIGSIEYEVRWFHDGRDFKARFFEDELEARE